VPSVNEDSQTSRLEPTRWNHTKQPNTKRSSDHCISKVEAIDRIIKHRPIHQADTEAEQPDSIIHGSHLTECSDRFNNKAKPQPSSRKATVHRAIAKTNWYQFKPLFAGLHNLRGRRPNCNLCDNHRTKLLLHTATRYYVACNSRENNHQKKKDLQELSLLS